MISDEFEKTLQKAQDSARTYYHQYMTLEHLLLAMTDDKDVIKVLDACNVNMDSLKARTSEFC